MITIREIHGGEVNELWTRFCLSHGDVSFAYRAFPVPRERVWVCDGGWVSLIPDTFGSSQWYRAGVFPGYERQGLRAQLRVQIAHEAFRDPGCRALHTCALLSNPKQCLRLMREARSGVWMPYAGTISIPEPGYAQFTMTRAWYEDHVK